MDHAGCVLWPLSKLLGRQIFKVISDRALVTCVIHDHALGMNYLISRVLVANILPSSIALKKHRSQPWWLSSEDLPRGEAEVMFIPGDVIDSADGECSGAMYELASQTMYRTELFEYWGTILATEINEGRVSISYSVAAPDDESGEQQRKITKGMREVYDCVILSLIHMWRLGHQITLANPSLRRIFDVSIPTNLLDDLAEYHSLLARGNNSFPKIVPLTMAEVTRPYDLTLKFWRECELLQISTDLCYMYLGTGMPLMSVTCPIYGMKESMYRNVNMTRKYRMGERYVSDIHEARRLIDTSSDVPDDIIRVAAKNVDDYTITDIAGMIIMPYSGLSVAHVLSGARGTIIRDSFLWSLRERLIIPSVFKQLYMNWLLTLYNLHFSGGIIHGDLHAGNVTMYTNYTGYEQKYILPRTADKSTVDVYIQKSGDPYIGRIIDFSRSFITGVGPITTRHSAVSIQTVLEDQRERLLVSISRASPGIYKSLEGRIREILGETDDWSYMGIVDEIYLSRALLEIFKGLKSGHLDSRYVSSQVFDASTATTTPTTVEKMDIPDSIIQLLDGFITRAEEYLVKKIRNLDPPEYPTIGYIRDSGFFDDMKCMEMPMDKVDGLKIGDDVDGMTSENGACSMNAGNRCMTSMVSFGTTIRDDIYMALVDAGDKFPKADKNKIRIMLDIHDRNDEWYTLAEDVLNG